MNFRSYADMARLIASAHALSNRFDLVVGIPRSGMIPANMIALGHSLPLADLDGYLEGRVLGRGFTRVHEEWDEDASTYDRVLVVDDTVDTGASMIDARDRIERLKGGANVTYAAIYGRRRNPQSVDFALEHCPKPRIFEWNMHHAWLPASACYDLDGVLCRDPSDAENDDGPRYREFILNAPPLALPSRPIRRIVTSRLESWRPETEAWLQRHGVEYEHLDMLDLPSAEHRRRQGSRSQFKASVFAADPGATLFVESETSQADAIARRSGKPVLDYSRMCLASPHHLTWAHQAQGVRRFARRARSAASRRWHRLLS